MASDTAVAEAPPQAELEQVLPPRAPPRGREARADGDAPGREPAGPEPPVPGHEPELRRHRRRASWKKPQNNRNVRLRRVLLCDDVGADWTVLRCAVDAAVPRDENRETYRCAGTEIAWCTSASA